MNSEYYKSLISHRDVPECHIPEYTLINHSKIDFMIEASKLKNSEFFCWIDFGYFALKERIPLNLVDINKLDKNRINYTLINPIDNRDSDVLYTLRNAPERIGGFFFFGERNVLKEYQELYHFVLKEFQYDYNIADDDQHLVLRCYVKQPDLFALHYLGGWHRALCHFQI